MPKSEPILAQTTDHARKIFEAGVQSVLGDELIFQTIQLENGLLRIDDQTWPLNSLDRVIVVGGGKAGGAMAKGLIKAWQNCSDADKPSLCGQLNVPDGCVPAMPVESIATSTTEKPPCNSWGDFTVFPARPAGANEPTPRAVEGTQEMIRWLNTATKRDLVLVLISGGGSALLCQPAAGLALDDKIAVTKYLSRNGADITQLNTVRKHLSDVKGGRLSQHAGETPLVTLVLSDVLGDPLDFIASGPTVEDTTTPQDALGVLGKFDPNKLLPKSVYEILQHRQSAIEVASQEQPPRTTAANRIRLTRVIGNNALAVDAAGIQAEALGYNHVMQCAQNCEGFANDVGRHVADMAVSMLTRDPALHRQNALITGGEPVVQLAEPSRCGKGGRNQQLVLAAYVRLLEIGLTSQQWSRLTILSGGTDGEDGPTDAAGAFIDAQVHQRAVDQNLSPEEHLRNNDAYPFFEATGGLLLTGPTGTNVCDIRVALVQPMAEDCAD